MGLIFGVALGLAVGAAGTAAWLLSEPDPGTSTTELTLANASQVASERLALLRVRFQAALAEGKREGAATEQRMRDQLHDARHRAGSSPSSSSTS